MTFNWLNERLIEWFQDSALAILFSTGFLSATLLPGGSEAIFIAYLTQQLHPIITLIIVVSAGNTLGGMVNYWLGQLFPLKMNQNKAGKVLNWLNKYGYFALLLSWLPIVGDPLCLVAGYLRMKWTLCLLFIAIGKFLRYGALALLVLNII